MEPEKERRATTRGEAIRAELVELLGDGGGRAANLLPRVESVDASLSEVAFQLGRLADEGRAVGAVGGVYRRA